MKPRITLTAMLLIGLCALLVLGGVLAIAAPLSQSPLAITVKAPPVPSHFYGTLKINGANPSPGTVVEARIGGGTYASAVVQAYGSDMVYTIGVPGDRGGTAAKEGGVEGETVQFWVGGMLCDQTGMWHATGRVNLNLTAASAVETATATATSLPTSTPSPTATPQPMGTPQVIDLTPNATTVRDTDLSSWAPSANNGNGQRIRVRSGVYNSLIFFDTSLIPSNAVVTRAVLRLRLDSYAHLPEQSPLVSVYKVKQSWDEYQATWTNRTTSSPWQVNGAMGALDRDTTPSGSTVVSAVNAWYEWEITGLVQDWVGNAAGNKGMLLISDNPRELRFFSANSPDLNYRPYLHVEYTPGGGPGPTAVPSVTPTSGPWVEPTPQLVEIRGASQDTYVNYLDQTKNYENQGFRIRGSGQKRALLNFDVSAIPSNAEVISATLRMTASEYNDGKTNVLNIGAYLVKRAWVANQATWLAAASGASWSIPGCDDTSLDRLGTPSGTTPVQQISGSRAWEVVTYDWDVTSIVQTWVENPSAKAGLLLMANDANFREVGFHDSAYSEVSRRPVLYVYWKPRAANPTPTVSPTPTGYGTIAGTVYNDLNANGRRDPGEPGLAGAVLQLFQNGVPVGSSQTTNSTGSFSFNVPPGMYTLTETDPPGYESSPTSGNSVSVLVIDGRTTEVNFADYNPAVATPRAPLCLPIILK